MRKLGFFFLGFSTFLLMGAVVTRVTNFTDGQVLTAGQLNAEFNNLVSNINSLNEVNFATTTQLPPKYISPIVAGDGIERNIINGALGVKVDGVTTDFNLAGELVAISAAPPVNSVTSAQIVDGTIQGIDIADGAIPASKLQGGGGLSIPTQVTTFSVSNSGAEALNLGTCPTGNLCVLNGSGSIHQGVPLNVSGSSGSINKAYTINYTPSRYPFKLAVECLSSIRCGSNGCRLGVITSGVLLDPQISMNLWYPPNYPAGTTITTTATMPYAMHLYKLENIYTSGFNSVTFRFDIPFILSASTANGEYRCRFWEE